MTTCIQWNQMILADFLKRKLPEGPKFYPDASLTRNIDQSFRSYWCLTLLKVKKIFSPRFMFSSHYLCFTELCSLSIRPINPCSDTYDRELLIILRKNLIRLWTQGKDLLWLLVNALSLSCQHLMKGVQVSDLIILLLPFLLKHHHNHHCFLVRISYETHVVHLFPSRPIYLFSTECEQDHFILVVRMKPSRYYSSFTICVSDLITGYSHLMKWDASFMWTYHTA